MPAQTSALGWSQWLAWDYAHPQALMPVERRARVCSSAIRTHASATLCGKSPLHSQWLNSQQT